MHGYPTRLEWTSGDRGTLTIRCETVEDFREVARSLSGDRPPVVFDEDGQGICVRALDVPTAPTPADLPRDVAFSICKTEPPPYSPRYLMRLANNELQRGMYIRVIGYTVDESSSPRHSLLTLVTDSNTELDDIRTLTDHPRGSALIPPRGEPLLLRHLLDNGTPTNPFPQVVQIRLEEVSPEDHYPAPSEPPYRADEIRAWLIPIAQRWDLDQDLSAFTATFDPATRLEYREDRPYLTSDRFAVAGTIDQAFDVARPMVAVFNAAASLASITDTNYRPVELDSQAIALLRDSREIEHPPAIQSVRAKLIVDEDSNPWATDRRNAIRQAAVRHGSDPTVAQVLRLWMSRPHTWASLYVIVELIERQARASVHTLGWVKKKARELFRHTANTLPVDENLPRHGNADQRPPPKPMQFGSAVTLVRDVIGHWLLWMDEPESLTREASAPSD